MRIAITGASGFLGCELLRQLGERLDVEICAFTSRKDSLREKYPHVDHLIPVNNSDLPAFDFSGIDILLNCAFPRSVEDEAFASGLDFIQQLLMQAVHTGVGAVINISSQSVYSQKRLEPADESAPIVLESKYAVGKYATELLTNAICKNIPHTNIRLASLIGAGFDQRITNKFAKRIAAGEGITITGGKQLFGFMDVRDAAAGLICLMESEPGKWQNVYNLGTNKAYSLKEIADCVYAVGGKLGYHAPGLIVHPDGTWQNSAIVCSRFCEDFCWETKFALKDTLGAIFEADSIA